RQRAFIDDVGESFNVNRDFHLALVAAAGNPQLSQFARMLWLTPLGAPIFARQATQHPDEVSGWADDHAQMLAAVARGDADAAERLTREHIAATAPVED